MTKGYETIKGELMAAAEASIEKLLRWSEKQAKPNLGEIEQIVLEIRQTLSQKMAEAVIEQQVEVQAVPGPACPGCGQEMRYKDKHRKQVTSLVGELKLERGYYYCDHCKRGLFPPRPPVSARG
jgi:NADH pyrophosphatase NudC (nudix superfamily)